MTATATHGTQDEHVAYNGVKKQNVSHRKNKGVLKFPGKGVVDCAATDTRLADHAIGQTADKELKESPLKTYFDGLYQPVNVVIVHRDGETHVELDGLNGDEAILMLIKLRGHIDLTIGDFIFD